MSTAKHVAIIMDGNGRWAKQRGLPRAMGHKRGVEAVRALVRAVARLDLDCLTLYAFSSENWKRPEDEVDDLMNLMRRFIKSDLPEFIANDVRLKIIGDWQGLAPDIVKMLEDALEQTAGGSRTLAVALNYGSQQEIARAAAKAAAIPSFTTHQKMDPNMPSRRSWVWNSSTSTTSATIEGMRVKSPPSPNAIRGAGRTTSMGMSGL